MEIVRKILNHLPLVCGCMVSRNLAMVRDSKSFGVNWNRNDKNSRVHIEVTQCNHCMRLYLWTSNIHISGYSQFQDMYDYASANRLDIGCFRDMLIDSDIYWGVTDIRVR